MRRGWWWGFDPQFTWFGENPARHGRRRGRRPWFAAGDMKYVVLSLLAEKPMHGYEVMKALEEQTRGCYSPSPGTVYPTLQWLEDEGLVRVEEENGKKVYGITEEGRRFLEDHRATVDDIFARVEETIEHALSDPMPDVTRLVGRLVPLVYRLAWGARADRAKRDQVVTVLKEAVERLEVLKD